MTDYQGFLRRIAEYAPNPSPEEYYEEGYEVLRQCRAEAQAVINVPFPVDSTQLPNGSGESQGRQLQRHVNVNLIIADASARRFQAKKIYLRAVAAVRWSNARNAIIQSTPHPGQATQMQQTNNNLRNELAGITDLRIINEFRQADTQAGYWLQDDPSLTAILDLIRSSSA
ncbi:MAG: hypothetical protein Q9183_003372 [Haloplaca sp. 2 TL-2023]